MRRLKRFYVSVYVLFPKLLECISTMQSYCSFK